MALSETKIVWAETASRALRRVGSATIRQKIFQKVDGLLNTSEPEVIGKPLRDELRGLYRITFGRYRILYKVKRSTDGPSRIQIVTVQVAHVGLRRDVYIEAARLRRRGDI